MNEKDIISEMEKWSEQIVEQPNREFGNLPVCPFAKQSRLDKKIRWEVLDYKLDEVEVILKLIDDFQPNIHDIMIIVNPNKHESMEGFFTWVSNNLKPYADTKKLECLPAHPDCVWPVGSWITRWPYQCLLISTHALLKSKSEKLLNTKYYRLWAESILKELGIPRQ